MALLMATTRGLRRITAVSLVRSHGWNSTARLSCTKSNSRREPLMKLVTVRPGCTCLYLLVMLPFSTRSIRRSENISVCTPRSCLSPSRVSTASGMAPMPICRVDRSSMRPAMISPMRASTSFSVPLTCSCSGRLVAMNASMRSNDTAVLPCVRGIWSLISAMMNRALSTAARAASTDVPSEQLPWRSGGESCTMATSSATPFDANSDGTSDRKMGTKSAWPRSMGPRRHGPVKSEIEWKRCQRSPSSQGALPARCRW